MWVLYRNGCYIQKANFFGGENDDKLLAGIECNGREKTLQECRHAQIGDVACSAAHSVAGVMCTNCEYRERAGEGESESARESERAR